MYSSFAEGYGSGVFAAKPAAGGARVTQRRKTAWDVINIVRLIVIKATIITANLLVTSEREREREHCSEI